MSISSKAAGARTSAPKSPPRKTAQVKTASTARAKTASGARLAPAAAAPKRLSVTTSRVAAAVQAPKPDKPRKPKLVRDSFTIPKTEYTVLEDLKQRAAKAGTLAKKSEILRAGIKALSAMDDASFRTAMNAVPAIKTGRPAGTSAL